MGIPSLVASESSHAVHRHDLLLFVIANLLSGRPPKTRNDRIIAEHSFELNPAGNPLPAQQRKVGHTKWNRKLLLSKIPTELRRRREMVVSIEITVNVRPAGCAVPLAWAGVRAIWIYGFVFRTQAPRVPGGLLNSPQSCCTCKMGCPPMLQSASAKDKLTIWSQDRTRPSAPLVRGSKIFVVRGSKQLEGFDFEEKNRTRRGACVHPTAIHATRKALRRIAPIC